jgi:uncharacterized integral membrane protein
MNSQEVHIDYYFADKPTDLMYVILASLFIGALMGIFALLGVVLRLKHELSKKKREVKLVEKEVANLRSLPLKDKH